MKPKNISLMMVLVCAGMTLTMFQNCSKVAVADLQNTAASSKPADNVAVATDGQGNVVPVSVDDPAQIVPPDSEPQNVDHEVVVKEPVSEPNSQPVGSQPDESQPVSSQPSDSQPESVPPAGDSESMASVCGLDLKTIHSVIDLAQFKDQDVHLDLIKGKTLIYSSDPQVTLKSLSIDAAVGRTILCGCKVDKLDVKKGRLEVYHSEIKEMGDQRGKLIKDAESVLPAGF